MEEIKSDNVVKPKISALATWSLVLGIAGLILCILIIPVIFSILAIIFGIIALVKIDAGKGVIAGRSEAIVGIVLGGLWFVLIPFIANVAPGVLPISIPFIVSSRVRHNEISAFRSLKLMTSVEATWYQQDPDGNGVKDYWTYDISCFNRALRADNETRVAFISLDVAMADAKPARSNVFGDKHFRFVDLPGATSMPKSGYYFQMMELDQDGNPYNQEKVNGVLATNKRRFAIVAYPAIYGSTGVKTCIVNQEGTIYYNDCGSDAQKIILQWPGSNPAGITGPSGKRWRVYS